jgi:hypothetical protein
MKESYQSIYAPTGVTSEEYRQEVEQSLTDTRYVVEHEDYASWLPRAGAT